MPPIRERIKTSAGFKSAEQSPLLSLRKQINTAVAQYISQNGAQIAALIVKSIPVASLREVIAKGEMGPKGERGEKGATGPQGPRGLIGPQGARGANGKDGKTSFDAPDVVVETINKSSKKIQRTQIAGLEDELRQLRSSKAKGGSGGGMGNVQHETKNVSSATTTITTNKRIAGAGYAIWAYYQGQLIMRGTHYTVGADRKTLTLMFTPSDDTQIDIIYIRT